jgi:FKBP-type peptidyl-prolyl cis-trans isomerase 2
MADVAEKGKKVTVHYKGTLEDGSVFDSSEGKDPISFEIGGKQVVPGFENAVEGMKVGEKKSVTLEPKDAYGDPNPQLKQEVPMDALKQSGITPEEGMVLGIQHPQMPGQQLPAKIVEVKEETVLMDLNHPLAGKKLTFDVELVSVE